MSLLLSHGTGEASSGVLGAMHGNSEKNKIFQFFLKNRLTHHIWYYKIVLTQYKGLLFSPKGPGVLLLDGDLRGDGRPWQRQGNRPRLSNNIAKESRNQRTQIKSHNNRELNPPLG
jgi:hypothetical protein